MRPEVASLGRSAAGPAAAVSPRHAGEVQSVLFDGANSAVLLQEARTRREFRIALPQTGQFSDLKPQENAWCSASIPSAPCAFRARRERRDRMASAAVHAAGTDA